MGVCGNVCVSVCACVGEYVACKGLYMLMLVNVH